MAWLPYNPAAVATVQALARAVSREQKLHRRLQRFVMPNITTRGAWRRNECVRPFSIRKLVPEEG